MAYFYGNVSFSEVNGAGAIYFFWSVLNSDSWGLYFILKPLDTSTAPDA